MEFVDARGSGCRGSRPRQADARHFFAVSNPSLICNAGPAMAAQKKKLLWGTKPDPDEANTLVLIVDLMRNKSCK